MLIRNNTKIIETQPQYTEEWTRAGGGLRFGPGRGRGEMAPGMSGRGGMEFPGSGDFGRMGGPPGMQGVEERKGEATIAISLPLKSLKKGTYTLQIHARDVIADVNLFHRVPIVIQ
jgi:hypothetical protein